MKILSRFCMIATVAILSWQTNAHAQFSITPGGLNNGIGAFQNGAVNVTLAGSGQAGANFRPGTLASTPDHQFQSAWFFRGPGDTREFAFGNGASGSVTSAGVINGNNLGTLDTGGYDYSVGNTAGGYAFRSLQRWQIFNPTNTAGSNVQVIATNDITNVGNAAATFSLFFYQDFDVNGTAGTDVGTLLGPNSMRITDAGQTIDWNAPGANAWSVGAFGATRLTLNDALVTNFANTGLPFGPGDFTGAYQWDVTLNPGQSVTLSSDYTLNPIPEPTSFCVLGFASIGLLARRRRV